jgi:hypothetical protein
MVVRLDEMIGIIDRMVGIMERMTGGMGGDALAVGVPQQHH